MLPAVQVDTLAIFAAIHHAIVLADAGPNANLALTPPELVLAEAAALALVAASTHAPVLAAFSGAASIS